MSALIEAIDIHKTYVIGRSEIKVLRGACLRADPAETVAIVGVSGAGKSTLLHALGGLDRPDEGHVVISDEDLYELSSRDRATIRATRIGFVFQSYHLLPEMDVLENVMLPAMAIERGPSSRVRARQMAMELLKSVGLGERANHTPMELSGGEQQRVALARALMNGPQFVLADEPTGNLDEGTGGLVLDYLFGLTRERSRTLLVVTHDERIASKCDRVLRLHDGVLVGA